MMEEVKKRVASLKNRKTEGADQLVKYGGEGMLTMMSMLYNYIWINAYATKRWKK